MGIANTTASAALVCAFTGADPAAATGRGTGIDDPTWERKVGGRGPGRRGGCRRRRRPRRRHWPRWPRWAASSTPRWPASSSGRPRTGHPVLLDGAIAGAAALAVQVLCPAALEYAVAGHVSHEAGHAMALEHLGLRPLLGLDLRLGEGTGALLALPWSPARPGPCATSRPSTPPASRARAADRRGCPGRKTGRAEPTGTRGVPMRADEVHGLSQLARLTLRGATTRIHEVHQGIADRAFSAVGPAGAPVKLAHDAIAGLALRQRAARARRRCPAGRQRGRAPGRRHAAGRRPRRRGPPWRSSTARTATCSSGRRRRSRSG